MNMDLGDLRQSLERNFSLEELNTLCFDLGINFDNLSGTTLNSKTRELIRYCQRNNKISELIEELHSARPDANWPAIPAKDDGNNFQTTTAEQEPENEEQFYQASANQNTPQAYDSLATFERAQQEIWTLKSRIQNNEIDERFFDVDGKGLKMQPFKPPQNIPNVQPSLSHSTFQEFATGHGRGWIPPKTRGLQGIDLTGTWVATIPIAGGLQPQGFVRQFGRYIAITIVVSGRSTLFSEGIINPADWSIRFIGKNLYNATLDTQLQLQPNWRLVGLEYHIFQRMGLLNNLLGRKSEPFIRGVMPVSMMRAA